jgi:hypothetical protein
MIQIHNSQPHVKSPAWIHLAHTAFAPPYATLLLSTEQLTEHMTGFEHFIETFCNYNFYYYFIPKQPYAWFSPAHTTNHYFLQLHVPNPQHSSNHCLSFSKLAYFNSDMLSGKRPLGRPRRRWEDNIKMDLQEVEGGCGNWMELAQHRDRWRAILIMVISFGFRKMREISWLPVEPVSFSRRTPLHAVSM